MPRRARRVAGGVIYHVLNRGCGKMKLFTREGDYDAFVKLLTQALARHPTVGLLSFCIMPNHWHLVLQPSNDKDLSRFMFWLTMTHAMRWRHARQLVGLGPLYQGRFKAFAVETDGHLLTVIRYVERNALRAKLVQRAEDWKPCSLYLRTHEPAIAAEMLRPWPLDIPQDWLETVNQPQTDREVEEMRRHIARGTPYGNPAWVSHTAKLLGIQLTPKPRGRPFKSKRHKKPR